MQLVGGVSICPILKVNILSKTSQQNSLWQPFLGHGNESDDFLAYNAILLQRTLSALAYFLRTY